MSTLRTHTSRTEQTVLLLASTLTVIMNSALSPALPALGRSFSDVSDFFINFIITLPGIIIAVTSFVVPTLLQRFQTRTFLITIISIYGLGGSLAFFVPDLTMIYFSRVLLGLAVAGIMISVTVLISSYYQEPSVQKQMLGLQSGAMAFGGVVIFLIAGLLADIDWRYNFLLYSVALLLVPFLIIFVHKEHSDDIVETTLTPSESTPKHSHLLTRLSVFTLASTFIIFTLYSLVLIHLPRVLVDRYSSSGSVIGLVSSTATLTIGIVSITFRWLSNNITRDWLFALTFITVGGGFILVAIASTLAVVFVGVAILGVGIGLFMPSLNFLIIESVDGGPRNTTLSYITLSLFFGQFISPLTLLGLQQITSELGVFMISGIVCASLAVPFMLYPITTRITRHA